jgi:hypothetical protein
MEPESVSNTARSTGAQAAERTYTADEVRELMRAAWQAGRIYGHVLPGETVAMVMHDGEDMIDCILEQHKDHRG